MNVPRKARGACAGALATLLLGLGAGGAAAAVKTEHGVNRAKLAEKATAVVEARNGIDVLKISRCSPQRRKRGNVNYSVWSCYWRAEGEYPGKVPYHCSGKAKWKRKKRSWIVDRCENIMQPQAPLLDVPNPHPLFGYNDDWANHLFMDTAAHARAIRGLLADTHSQVIRMNILWEVVEAKRGSYDWSAFDELNSQFTSLGMRPLWVAIAAPCWAQPDPQGCAAGDDKLRPSVANFDAFADFAAAAAKRYPNAVGVEIWNEPNYPRFWGGWPEPDNYASMLKKAADAIHARAPGMPVVSGGLSPHADSDQNAVGFSNFLERLYERGAAEKADAIGIHPYAGVGPNEDYIADIRVYLGKVQREMAQASDSGTPMWATEFGFSTTGPHAFSLSQQAQALSEAYELMRRVQRIDLAILNGLVDNPRLAEREGGWGVVNPDLSRKPAFCAINAVRGASC